MFKKCLLAENRLVAFQPVAVERVPPVACAHVRIFAAPAVTIPFRHGDVPAVRHLEKHFLRRRQNFRRDDFLSGLRVWAAAQFAIGCSSGHRGCGGGGWRTEFRHARQARSRRGGDCRGRKRQLNSHDIACVKAQIVARQILEAIALHQQQISSGREVGPAEHAVRVGRDSARHARRAIGEGNQRADDSARRSDLARFLAGPPSCAEFAAGFSARLAAETRATESRSRPRRNAGLGCALKRARRKVCDERRERERRATAARMNMLR